MRRGRPQTAPVDGARNSLGLKVMASTKRALSEAGRLSGRSMSQEAEARILWSFERGRLLAEVLEAARAGTLSEWARDVEAMVSE